MEHSRRPKVVKCGPCSFAFPWEPKLCVISALISARSFLDTVKLGLDSLHLLGSLCGNFQALATCWPVTCLQVNLYHWRMIWEE